MRGKRGAFGTLEKDFELKQVQCCDALVFLELFKWSVVQSVALDLRVCVVFKGVDRRRRR